MTIIETQNLNDSNYQGNFQTVPTQRKTKVAAYLDSIYSHPPKIKIKWDTLNDFTGNLLAEENSNLPLSSDLNPTWSSSQTVTTEDYTVKQYLKGHIDKVKATKFYGKNTKTLQVALQEVPVFVILNGNGEIILTKPSRGSEDKTINSLINEKIYNFCGAFDPIEEKRQQIGLFFMNYTDAKTYLKAVAQTDIGGTKKVGLSINCISLKSAYIVSRENHPGIDFRFVPNLKEVQNFLSTHVKNSDIIVDDFTGRTLVGRRERGFKGVPIYMITVNKIPRNQLVESYFNVTGAVRNLIPSHGNHILRGRLQDTENSGPFETYVFFEKTQASQFVKYQTRNVTRYKGFQPFGQKPKIFVSNLEDFLESCEDTIITDLKTPGLETNVLANQSQPVINANSKQLIGDYGLEAHSQTIKRNTLDLKVFKNNQISPFSEQLFRGNNIRFICPPKTADEVLNFQKTFNKSSNNIIKKISQNFKLKVRVLKRNLVTLVTVN